MKLNNVKRAMASLAIVFGIATSASADLLVIVHPDNQNKIEAKFVKNLFLGKETRFANGDTAIPLMLDDNNPLTQLFLKQIVKQKPVQFKRLWSKALFTGKGTPPEVLGSDAEVLRLVMNNPSMVGFIDDSQFTNDVRAVLRIRTN
jgi:hypothetical protein